MKLILITNAKSAQGRIEVSKVGLCVLLLAMLVVPVLLGILSFYSIKRFDDPALNQSIADRWKEEVQKQKLELQTLKQESELALKGLGVSLARAQARLIRMEALGEKLLSTGKIRKGEFDFSSEPAVGGLEHSVDDGSFKQAAFSQAMDAFLVKLEQREKQLHILDSLLENKLMEEEVFLAGRPIKKGWMSSFYGKRLDPFTGKLAIHKGVDFAGKEDSEIIAVGSGVVTWSGDRYGYGQMVEIDHGQGFKTRYAHNKKNLVAVGDIVRKGQTIAQMGSTGRSTGPHTHFEVWRHGRVVNPERYVYRESP